MIFNRWKIKSNTSLKLLLEDDDVRRRYGNSKRSSALNADVRLRRLNLFCNAAGMTPKEFADIGKKDSLEVENVLLDLVSWMEKEKYAPKYILNVIKCLKSWLEFNRVEIKRKIKVKNASIPVAIQDEQVPT